MVDYVIIALPDAHKALPSLARVGGLIDLPGAGPQQNTLRICRVRGETANISPVRTYRDERLAMGKKGENEDKAKRNESHSDKNTPRLQSRSSVEALSKFRRCFSLYGFPQL